MIGGGVSDGVRDWEGQMVATRIANSFFEPRLWVLINFDLIYVQNNYIKIIKWD